MQKSEDARNLSDLFAPILSFLYSLRLEMRFSSKMNFFICGNCSVNDLFEDQR